MARYQEIKKKIQGKYNSLPKNQQKIADYLIDNLDEIPFLSIHRLSKATNVSVATIVRVAQSIGFTGFTELRSKIANSLKSQLNNKEIFPLFEKHSAKEDLLTEVANLDIKNINDTLHLIDRENFNHCIDAIVKAQRVYTAGLGISYLLAEILAYQLTQVGIDASVLKHTSILFHEQVLFLNKNDLILCFSFPPYSKETIDAARFAKEKGIKVISITNKEASPITFHSEVYLTVKSDNMLFTNSFAAISVIINAIATQCALQNKIKANSFLTETQKIMDSQKLVIK
ncbi:MAG: MurR/RpiR family transcriptional regulator [Ignavibacteriaceae bacterium]|nr:MurR/RpiR family transcriptional regulator [Ignavibacteriaceae bacterium]